jgi:hypothetical protein
VDDWLRAARRIGDGGWTADMDERRRSDQIKEWMGFFFFDFRMIR